MNDRSSNDRHTAIHEAGHAVAHHRLNIMQAYVSIESENIYDDEGNLMGQNLGRVTAEGAKHVYSKAEAEDQALAFCSGYAALLAAGYSEAEALRGADDDFEWTRYLIDRWQLADESEWRRKALSTMCEAVNIAAVARISEELLEERRLEMHLIELLVDVADGQITEEKYQLIKRAFINRP